MIKVLGNCIKLDTPNTSLIFRVNGKKAEQIYYGRKIKDFNQYDVFGEQEKNIQFASCDDYESIRAFFSSSGDGSCAESLVIVQNADGSYINRFDYTGYEIIDQNKKENCGNLPKSRNKSQTLIIYTEDKYAELCLELKFAIFDDSDVIACQTCLLNKNSKNISILRCMSLQLEIESSGLILNTFDGGWARERFKNEKELAEGIIINDSKGGSSSNKHNPFVLVRNVGFNETYGFNLIYSGNHKEIFDTDSEKTRILIGINDYLFNYTLKPNECFESPEAIMVYAENTENVTANMHSFILNHIIPPKFKNMPRPILLNNWEATYFDFDSNKIMSLVKKACSIGVEMFVLDDGWFGKRDNDKSSLGDWLTENPKLGGGLAIISNTVKQNGMKFGLWLEPEMVNPDSELFLMHPEFAMTNGREPILKRNQLMLDLTSEKVQNYLIDSITEVIKKYNPDYIKWDYNRNMTDMFGKTITNQGEYFYRYILGLYRILENLTERFPEILFEGCASGGNRYDLGILYYMPQIWASDNTDARDRVFIQEGTLNGYHQSTMGAHISICPNHQTGNNTSLENRFNVAAAGVLGLELDLNKCNEEEIETIKEQIVFYKKYKNLFQFGKYYLLGSAFDINNFGWIYVSEDKSEAIAVVGCKKKKTGINRMKFCFKGLNENNLYSVQQRKQRNDISKKSILTAYGDALMTSGVDLGDVFADTDRGNNSNSIGTRMFYIRKKEE
jgi:alpha-galactosidase